MSGAKGGDGSEASYIGFPIGYGGQKNREYNINNELDGQIIKYTFTISEPTYLYYKLGKKGSDGVKGGGNISGSGGGGGGNSLVEIGNFGNNTKRFLKSNGGKGGKGATYQWYVSELSLGSKTVNNRYTILGVSFTIPVLQFYPIWTPKVLGAGKGGGAGGYAGGTNYTGNGGTGSSGDFPTDIDASTVWNTKGVGGIGGIGFKFDTKYTNVYISTSTIKDPVISYQCPKWENIPSETRDQTSGNPNGDGYIIIQYDEEPPSY